MVFFYFVIWNLITIFKFNTRLHQSNHIRWCCSKLLIAIDKCPFATLHIAIGSKFSLDKKMYLVFSARCTEARELRAVLIMVCHLLCFKYSVQSTLNIFFLFFICYSSKQSGHPQKKKTTGISHANYYACDTCLTWKKNVRLKRNRQNFWMGE